MADMAASAHSQELITHLELLNLSTKKQEDDHELSSSPIFTAPVLREFSEKFSQYGFLAGDSDLLDEIKSKHKDLTAVLEDMDPRVYFNISAPSSVFICGSQGSGKSHTLSCLLENCLTKSNVSKLENPLAGLVFHYDSFISDARGTPCEAAHLSSDPNIKVRILCSPTNLQTIKRTYSELNVQVEPLRIDQTDLNTKRMLDLMAVTQDDGKLPLYLHAISRILREMRLIQQETNEPFNYGEFKRLVKGSLMSPSQLMPLTQRLDTLESFMPKSQTEVKVDKKQEKTQNQNQNQKQKQKQKKKQKQTKGNDWSIKPGSLTIVDLSCPCVTSEGACALFSMCLDIFLEQEQHPGSHVGKIVALDEAHKYMNSASEATALTNTLLSAIRLQRHAGVRVLISTQEPSISEKLLDLCSITIVHRFTSPDWLRCLKSHLAALDNDEKSAVTSPKLKLADVFNQIVGLRVGEALLFAPSAITSISKATDKDSGETKIDTKKLGIEYMRVKVRARVTEDGGRSVLALAIRTPAPASSSGKAASTLLSKGVASTAPSTLMSSTNGSSSRG